jgi:hypothetical protein
LSWIIPWFIAWFLVLQIRSSRLRNCFLVPRSFDPRLKLLLFFWAEFGLRPLPSHIPSEFILSCCSVLCNRIQQVHSDVSFWLNLVSWLQKIWFFFGFLVARFWFWFFLKHRLISWWGSKCSKKQWRILKISFTLILGL